MASPLVIALVVQVFQTMEPLPTVGAALDAAQQNVVCEVRASKRVFKVGESPGASVKIFNLGREAVYLPGSLDASERGKRYPHVSLEIRGPEGSVSGHEIIGCGNVNAIRAKDFVLVEPGHFFDPYEEIDAGGFFPPWNFEVLELALPGTYEVTFHYSTDQVEMDGWNHAGEDVAPAAVELLQRTPRVSIQCSTTLRVEP